MKFKTIWQLFMVCMVLQVAGEARSEPCFIPLYYEKMFEQTALESESKDNAILVAEGDPLTATGTTEDCKDGCRAHINNGRFDLLLRNAAAEGPDRAPLTLQIQQIRLGFQNLEGLVSDKWVQIEKQQIADRFGTPVSLKKGRPYNSPEGHSANPEFIEPGEGIIGCVSLSQEDRTKTGKAIIEVSYDTMVWMLDLTKNVRAESLENRILWRAQHEIRDLEQDDVRFYKFTVPHETQAPSDIRIFLANAQGLEIYNRQADEGWSQNIGDWQAGEPALSGENAGKTFFLMVRAVDPSASGTVKAEYMTGGDSMTPSESDVAGEKADVFAPTPVGPPSTQTFKAYALGAGGEAGDTSAE